MATANIQYAALTTAVESLALSGLANGESTAGAAIDNSTVELMDYHIFVRAKGAQDCSGTLAIYAAGSLDNSDFESSANHSLLGVVDMTTTVESLAGPFSIAAAFGGNPPKYFKIVADNADGDGALEASDGASLITYMGIEYTSA